MKRLLNKVLIFADVGNFTLYGNQKCNVEGHGKNKLHIGNGKVKNFTVNDCKWKYLSIRVYEQPFRLSLCRVKVYGTCESKY